MQARLVEVCEVLACIKIVKPNVCFKKENVTSLLLLARAVQKENPILASPEDQLNSAKIGGNRTGNKRKPRPRKHRTN